MIPQVILFSLFLQLLWAILKAPDFLLAQAKKTAKGECPSGRLRLKDHKDAVRTLHKAKTAGQIELAMNGATNRQETRTYFCGMCKGHHLTSKREWTTFTGPVAA